MLFDRSPQVFLAGQKQIQTHFCLQPLGGSTAWTAGRLILATQTSRRTGFALRSRGKSRPWDLRGLATRRGGVASPGDLRYTPPWSGARQGCEGELMMARWPDVKTGDVGITGVRNNPPP